MAAPPTPIWGLFWTVIAIETTLPITVKTLEMKFAIINSCSKWLSLKLKNDPCPSVIIEENNVVWDIVLVV